MSRQLSTDCLIKIFEILEEDKIALHSCLLVNRFWCRLSVGILWRNVWSFECSSNNIWRNGLSSNSRSSNRKPSVDAAILSTLVACLPSESKELLNKNEIFIQTPTSKPPLFNYAAFCEVLSIYMIGEIIDYVLNDGRRACAVRVSRLNKNNLVAKEILKMFMNQISSLKSLTYYPHYLSLDPDIFFIYFPGARDCLADLSELCCSSDVHSEFFYELSQICHNLHSLSIKFESDVSNGLKELISSQNNLKNLKLFAYDQNNWEDIISTLTKHSNTLTKLCLYSKFSNLPLSFVSLFTNLQELKFSLVSNDSMDEYFNGLQHVAFPKLKTFKIPYNCPTADYLMKFLEINGKNLEEFCIEEYNNALKYIVKFCPNLKRLYVRFTNGELDMLKTIFNSFQYLESLKIMCKGEMLSAKMLESVAKYSPKNFYELKIHTDSHSSLCLEELESFFISWKNRTPMRSLSLIILENYRYSEENKENIKIIKKYIDLGIIKPTKFNDDNDDDYDDDDLL